MTNEKDRSEIIDNLLTKEYLMELVKEVGYNVSEIAKITGVSWSSVNIRLRKYGLINKNIRRRNVHDFDSYFISSHLSNEIDLPKDFFQTDLTKYYNYDASEREVFVLIGDTHIGKDYKNEEHLLKETVGVFRNLYLQTIDKLTKLVSSEDNKWKAINIVLLGDIVDGINIYPNQRVMSPIKQVQIAKECLYNFIKSIKSQLDTEVNVYTVSGNHGRVSKYATKSDNWDTVTYMMLRELFDAEDENVVTDFRIFKEDYGYVETTGTNRLLFTHGDVVNSRNGKPYNIILDKAQKVVHDMDLDYDVFCLGHFHQFFQINRGRRSIIMNGTTNTSKEFAINIINSVSDYEQTLFTMYKNKVEDVFHLHPYYS